MVKVQGGEGPRSFRSKKVQVQGVPGPRRSRSKEFQVQGGPGQRRSRSKEDLFYFSSPLSLAQHRDDKKCGLETLTNHKINIQSH